MERGFGNSQQGLIMLLVFLGSFIYAIVTANLGLHADKQPVVFFTGLCIVIALNLYIDIKLEGLIRNARIRRKTSDESDE